MSKDLEDSTENMLGSQRKGSQLNSAKESNDIFERPKKQNTQTNFDKRCQSLITNQTKIFIVMVWNISPPWWVTWHESRTPPRSQRTSSKDPRSKTLKPISTSVVNHSSPSKPMYLLSWFGTFLPLDEWLDTNQAQRNGLKCKNQKISSKWSKAKGKSRRITRNETNQSQKSVPKDMGNGSTQPINKAWPLKKEAGLNTVMQWQNTGSSRKRQKLNTTDARACKSSNSAKMLNLSQYSQLPMSAALKLSTPPG